MPRSAHVARDLSLDLGVVEAYHKHRSGKIYQLVEYIPVRYGIAVSLTPLISKCVPGVSVVGRRGVS